MIFSTKINLIHTYFIMPIKITISQFQNVVFEEYMKATKRKPEQMKESGKAQRNIRTTQNAMKRGGRKAAISDYYDRTPTSVLATGGDKQSASTANHRLLRKSRL
jgi:hypothetical protein